MAGLIDLRRWKRRDHYLLFRKYERPFFSVTVDVDVTAVVEQVPVARDGVLLSVVVVSHAERRQRCRGVPPASSAARRVAARSCGRGTHDHAPGRDLRIRAPRPADTLSRVCVAGAGGHRGRHRAEDSVRGFRRHRLSLGAAVASLLVVHQCAARQSAIPFPVSCSVDARRRAARIMMPVAVEVHHALVDGLDVARFFERFNTYLERP